MALKVGDKVNYCVDEVHSKAMVPKTSGDPKSEQFPWVFGWRSGKQVVNAVGEREFEVEELTDRQLWVKLQHLRKQPGARPGRGGQVVEDARKREAAKLVMLRPRHYWDAVVTAVSPDGKTASIDVTDPTTGATLHYTVPVDHAGKKAHSCHAPATKAGDDDNGFKEAADTSDTTLKPEYGE